MAFTFSRDMLPYILFYSIHSSPFHSIKFHSILFYSIPFHAISSYDGILGTELIFPLSTTIKLGETYTHKTTAFRQSYLREENF